MASSQMPVSAVISVDGWRDVQRSLKKYAPDVRKDMNREIRAAVKDIASQAKGNAASIPTKRGGGSRRIPGAIGVSVTNTGAAVRVSRKKAPHGSLFERGGAGGGGVFRHPLFGDRDVWYQQQTHPFIQPAVDAGRDKLLFDIEVAMRRAASRLGF